MPKIIKIKCNGPNKCINEIDINKALGTTVVLRGGPTKIERPIPKRIVKPCQFCTVGKVIITCEILEENL